MSSHEARKATSKHLLHILLSALTLVASTHASGKCMSVDDATHPCRHNAAGDRWCVANSLPPFSFIDACLDENHGYAAPGTRWIQIASRANLGEAQALAQDYSWLPYPSGVFPTESGWYAVVIGPVEMRDAEEVLARLKGSSRIPGDSLLSLGKSYLAHNSPAVASTQRQSESADPNDLMPMRISLDGIVSGRNSPNDKGFGAYVRALVGRYSVICGGLPPAAQALHMESNLQSLATMWNLFAANLDGAAPGIRQLPGGKENELLEPIWILGSEDRDKILGIYAENTAQAVADAQILVATQGCNGAVSIIENLSLAVP
ncbi:MAG: SPOR domain-containing protein [Thiohalocapsa sp. PB-PSB1]|jgi:hypothetical protein|nr:MAG: SPOR domain-containing protein [Thiohalocapsa sp. PB-PSB1]